MKIFSDPVQATLMTILAPISWGTTYIVVTELLPPDRPLTVAALRVLPAGLALALAGLLHNRWRPRGDEWRRIAALAFFNFGVFFPLLIVAVYRLPGGVAASVGGTQPLLVAALTWFLVGSRPRKRDLTVGVIAALGVALVVVRRDANIDAVGVAAALGANASFSLGVVLTKSRPAMGPRLAVTGWQLLLSAVVIAPAMLLLEGPPPALTTVNVLGFAYLSLAGTGLAFVLWFAGIQRLGPLAPPLLGLAAPLTGAILGWAMLGEDLSRLQLTGFFVTIAAIIYGATVAAADPRSLTSAPSPDPSRTARQDHRRGGRPLAPVSPHWRSSRR